MQPLVPRRRVPRQATEGGSTASPASSLPRLRAVTDDRATAPGVRGVVSRLAERHGELVKFATVGAITFVVDTAVFVTAKSTVLEPKPVTAKVVAVLVATQQRSSLETADHEREQSPPLRHLSSRLPHQHRPHAPHAHPHAYRAAAARLR